MQIHGKITAYGPFALQQLYNKTFQFSVDMIWKTEANALLKSSKLYRDISYACFHSNELMPVTTYPSLSKRNEFAKNCIPINVQMNRKRNNNIMKLKKTRNVLRILVNNILIDSNRIANFNIRNRRKHRTIEIEILEELVRP